jgi:putative FmdB family regulatory protein
VPTYQYACNGCGHEFEAVQSFSDDALTTCPECGGALRKLFGNVGVVFKGSGFYRNDARASSSGASDSSASSTPKSDTTSSGSATSDGGTSSSSSASTSTTAP